MLEGLAEFLVYRVLGFSPANRLGEALVYFLYDTVKILLLLAVAIFVVSYLRSFFSVEKAREILGKRREMVGNILAALLGVVTPFCSCSAVPMFLGFVEGGIPLGVTFSFLIASPMVNEVAVVLLLGLFGWHIALLYVAGGLGVAITGGYIIGRLHLEGELEEYINRVSYRPSRSFQYQWRDRIDFALYNVRDILRRVWPYVAVGIAIGAYIHGYVPADFLTRVAGRDNPLAVPVAVLIGVPLYSGSSGMIPIVKALVEKGMSLGTVLAFMMAVTALSFPEMIILRRVLKPRLIAIFLGIMTLSIIGVGYLFNAIV